MPWLGLKCGFQAQNYSVASYYCGPIGKLSVSEGLSLVFYAASLKVTLVGFQRVVRVGTSSDLR